MKVSKMKKIISLTLMLCMLIAALPATGYGADRNDGLDKKFKRGAYLVPSYQNKAGEKVVTDLDTIPFDQLDYIIYAFAEPYTDGTFRPLEDPNYLMELSQKAHAAGTEVFLGVGGGMSAMDLNTIASDENCTLRFIKVIKEAITTYDLDGIDIDWESPLPGESAANCEKLMVRLAAELKPLGIYFTAAIAGAYKVDEGNIYNNGFTDKCLAQFDWLHIMTYDMYQVNSPLSFADISLQYWHNARGIPKEKLVIGIPFYGKPNWKTYAEIIGENDDNAFIDRIEGSVGGVEDVSNYNGVNLVREKTKLTLENGGGMFSWTINWDGAGEHSLTKTIDVAIKEANSMGVQNFINKPTIICNNREIKYDAVSGFPYIDANGRTLVPFRQSLEAIGMTVSFDAANQMAKAEGNGITIQIPINQQYIIVNGTTVPIDTQASILNDRTYIPMRACFEAAGYKIKEWHNDTRTAYVVK